MVAAVRSALRVSGLLRAWLRFTLCLAFLLTFALPARADRFAVVVGNDWGQPLRERLWFSGRDADRFSRTLIELGEFKADHVMVLHDQGPAAVRAALAWANAALAAAPADDSPSLLLFYYSGHANSTGLELGNEQLTYAEIRGILEQSEARAKVAIVDACDAGALTGVRGARPVSATPSPVFDQAKGVAYVSSTAIGEAAQESSTLQGGFFTSHFQTALRGAADFDGDGHVTLSEAFRYTSVHTTADTAWTQAGPQHPTFDMRMSGHGDVVLSNLHGAEATLLLPAAEGSLFIVENQSGVESEVPGEEKPVPVALPAGRYRVKERRSNDLGTTEVFLERGERRHLSHLSGQAYAASGLRGDHLPLHAALSGGLGPAILGRGALALGASVFLSRPFGPVDLRLRVGYSYSSIVASGKQYSVQTGRLGLAGLWPALRLDRFVLEAGPELGFAMDWEQLRGGPGQSAGELVFGGVAALTVGFGWLRLGPELVVEGHLLNVDQRATVRPVVTGGIFVGF